MFARPDAPEPRPARVLSEDTRPRQFGDEGVNSPTSSVLRNLLEVPDAAGLHQPLQNRRPQRIGNRRACAFENASHLCLDMGEGHVGPARLLYIRARDFAQHVDGLLELIGRQARNQALQDPYRIRRAIVGPSVSVFLSHGAILNREPGASGARLECRSR